MAIEVILPKVDMDMKTGKVSRWLVAEGDAVKQGDPLLEIETDKAAMEIEAPASGILRNVVAKEGVDVPVGQAVAWIFAEGEQPLAVKPPPQAPYQAVSVQTSVAAPNAQAPAGPEPTVTAGVRATPLARRMAREAGIDLAAVAGSGPHGRVVKADIEQAAVSKVRPPADASAHSAAPPELAADAGIRKLFAEGSFTELRHDNMRKTIARRLVEAKSTVPHFYLSADCKLDAMLKLRAEVNASAPVLDGTPAYKLSINDMVIKAWALALRDVPMANVSWTDDTMLCHSHADIGVAVSVTGGLITPIIRNAENKTLSAISDEMKDLAQRAKGRKLKPEEYNGGSSAISNLGMFGVREFAAIINPPHATILAVGGGEERPVMWDGAVVGATVMTVTLSTDHRAVDGALGAQVLAAFRNYIEKPFGMLV